MCPDASRLPPQERPYRLVGQTGAASIYEQGVTGARPVFEPAIQMVNQSFSNRDAHDGNLPFTITLALDGDHQAIHVNVRQVRCHDLAYSHPGGEQSSTKAVSRIPRMVVAGLTLGDPRVERSSDLIVVRANVRGRLMPIFTSHRNPVSGLADKMPCRSRQADMDFNVASLRRTVRGLASPMHPSQRWTRSRLMTSMGTVPPSRDAKARKHARSYRYALRVCGLSLRWSAQCAMNHSIAEFSVYISVVGVIVCCTWRRYLRDSALWVLNSKQPRCQRKHFGEPIHPRQGFVRATSKCVAERINWQDDGHHR